MQDESPDDQYRCTLSSSSRMSMVGIRSYTYNKPPGATVCTCDQLNVYKPEIEMLLNAYVQRVLSLNDTHHMTQCDLVVELVACVRVAESLFTAITSLMPPTQQCTAVSLLACLSVCIKYRTACSTISGDFLPMSCDDFVQWVGEGGNTNNSGTIKPEDIHLKMMRCFWGKSDITRAELFILFCEPTSSILFKSEWG